MRLVLPLGLLLALATPALAQQPPSPLSGPNDSIPSPVCDIVNFGFCPQPAPPAPYFPDPNEAAVAVRAPMPPAEPRMYHHHRVHRHHRPVGG